MISGKDVMFYGVPNQFGAPMVGNPPAVRRVGPQPNAFPVAQSYAAFGYDGPVGPFTSGFIPQFSNFPAPSAPSPLTALFASQNPAIQAQLATEAGDPTFNLFAGLFQHLYQAYQTSGLRRPANTRTNSSSRDTDRVLADISSNATSTSSGTGSSTTTGSSTGSTSGTASSSGSGSTSTGSTQTVSQSTSIGQIKKNGK
jgi:hypothetical protein